MPTYTVYYERNGKPYRTTMDDAGRGGTRVRRAAINLACNTSEMVPGYVTVARNGIEIAACLKGKRVASKNPSDPLNRRARRRSRR